MRLESLHGVIENNHVARTKDGEITIGAEYGFWREAGWPEDITIEGNTIIEDVGRGADMSLPTMPAPARSWCITNRTGRNSRPRPMRRTFGY